MYLLLQVSTQTSVAGSSEVGRYGKGNGIVARGRAGKGRARDGARKVWEAAAVLVCRTFYKLGHLIVRNFCGYCFVKMSISLVDGVNGEK